jgi:hypothetical protein
MTRIWLWDGIWTMKPVALQALLDEQRAHCFHVQH